MDTGSCCNTCHDQPAHIPADTQVKGAVEAEQEFIVCHPRGRRRVLQGNPERQKGAPGQHEARGVAQALEDVGRVIN